MDTLTDNDSEYRELCERLKWLYVTHGTNYVQAAALAIESLQAEIARLRAVESQLEETLHVAWNDRDEYAVERDALRAENAELRSQVESLQNKWASRPLSVADTAALEAENDALRAQLAAAERDAGRYSELIYAVASKFPNESRHETALRYILQLESSALTAGCDAALTSSQGEKP